MAFRWKEHFGAHQVPLPEAGKNPVQLKQLEDWMKSYKPEELFDKKGKLIQSLADLAPLEERRMGANPHANGGLLMSELIMPDFKDYAVDVPAPGSKEAADTLVLGEFLRDIIKLNEPKRNFQNIWT